MDEDDYGKFRLESVNLRLEKVNHAFSNLDKWVTIIIR